MSLYLDTSCMRFLTLKKRSEFLRVRGGRRWSTPAFLVECRVRSESIAKNHEEICCKSSHCTMERDHPKTVTGARFGFTVTKKMGNAVVRNRMLRRLRAVIGELAPKFADQAFDYVIVARRPAFDRDFSDMKNDMRTAFNRLHGSQDSCSNQSRDRRRKKQLALNADSRPAKQ